MEGLKEEESLSKEVERGKEISFQGRRKKGRA